MEGGNLPECVVVSQPGAPEFGSCSISAVCTLDGRSQGQRSHLHGHRLQGSFRKTLRKLSRENSFCWSALPEVENLCDLSRHPGTMWALHSKPNQNPGVFNSVFILGKSSSHFKIGSVRRKKEHKSSVQVTLLEAPC